MSNPKVQKFATAAKEAALGASFAFMLMRAFCATGMLAASCYLCTHMH